MFHEAPRIVINSSRNNFVYQTDRMLKTRGEILEKAVRSSKKAITKVAEQKGVSQRHMYNLFASDNISNDDMLAFGKIIGYDFSKDIPELIEYMIIAEPDMQYKSEQVDWRIKYFELLEKHTRLLEEKIRQAEAKESKAGKTSSKKK